VKLRKAEQGQFVFQLGKREKLLLFEVLKFYPLIPSAHSRSSRAKETADAGSYQLIEEALAEQRSENKRQLQAMLADPSRFTERDGGWQFAMSHSDLEWLLQVLNDIRVGSWIMLGSPDPKEPRRVELSGQNAPYFWAMELCGHFETVLLHALSGEEV
jgi:hypothetical protein